MDKYINKFLDNPWFIRVIALILAVLLFENVNEKSQSVVNVPQDKEAEVIENVPVKSFYDADNLVVTGIPETVTLTLSGPKPNLQQAITQRGFEVYVDLTKAEIGKRKVPIKIKGISDRLKVSIEPEFAEVSIQEKVTQEFSVDVEFNSKIIADGYISEAPTIKPNKVKITGARDVVDQITYVKATLDAKGPIKDTLKKEAEILVLDQSLNKLNVEVEPNKVEVTLPVKASSKTVPIKLEQKGTLPNGISIGSISLEKEEATIIAPEQILKNTDSVRVELDVSNIKEDTQVTLPVLIPEGVVEVDPKAINVTIKVNNTEDKIISNLPIHIEGLPAEYKAVFREPTNGSASITVSGRREDLKNVDASDFNVFVDASNLDVGEHDVELKVEGPNHLNWKIAKGTVKISITQNEV